MRRVLKYLAVFLLWNLVSGLFLITTPPPAAILISLLLYAWILYGYLLRPGHGESARRRWAALRLRPLRGKTLKWSLAAVPVMLGLSWSVSDLYTRFVPVPAESLNPFAEMLATAEGRLMITLFAVGIAPVVEEFFFRGLIQYRLERRYRKRFEELRGADAGRLAGVTAGIAGGAALFAAVHLLPWIFPIHFFLGFAFGFAVWATRSIWTGVMLHAANNLAAMLSLVGSGEEAPATGTLWEFGFTADLWASVATFVVTGALALWMARRLARLRERRALPMDSEGAYLS